MSLLTVFVSRVLINSRKSFLQIIHSYLSTFFSSRELIRVARKYHLYHCYKYYIVMEEELTFWYLILLFLSDAGE